MKKMLVMSAMLVCCTTLSASAGGQSQEDLSFCFQPRPVNSVKDMIEGTKDALACVIRQLVAS